MLTSHQEGLDRAHELREPAGQLAARKLEIAHQRRLRRAESLDHDVAAAIEAA